MSCNPFYFIRKLQVGYQMDLFYLKMLPVNYLVNICVEKILIIQCCAKSILFINYLAKIQFSLIW